MATNLTQHEDIDEWLFEDPPTHLPFEFEKTADINSIKVWAEERLGVVAGLCFLYYAFVRVGPKLMKNREPFKLQKSLVLWNFLLAAFSIIGTVRVAPSFLNILSEPNGFHATCCIRKGLSQPAVFWSFAFAISKIFEFGDTVFIVLRKKPLIFLHWFHHLTMAFLSFLAISQQEPIISWAVIINYSVHSVMYTYYTIMALKIKLPKAISMLITSLQITQFIMMIFLNGYTIQVLGNGEKCARSWKNMLAQVSVGLVYLMLFLKFFYTTYILNKKKKTA